MNKCRILAVLILCIGFNFLLAEEGHDDHGEEHHDDHIEWTKDLQEEFGLETIITGPGTIQKVRELPGEIEFNSDYVSHVTSRYAGVVKEIYTHVGDTVKKGDRMAVVESNESLTTYTIKAPISGVVFEKHITIGESIPDSTEVFKLADTSHLWVNFHVYADLISLVTVGKTITIQHQTGTTLKTKVSYLAPSLSKDTRTQLARADIRSLTSPWAAGMFVTVLYPLEKIKGDIIIPKSALQRSGEKWVVFVKDGEAIAPQFVIPGEEDATHIVILKGLHAGQEIIGKGSFIVKAELGKESFGDGHGH